jgi:hypothetical protein
MSCQTFLLLALPLVTASIAHAETAGRCNRYANDAVHDYKQMRDDPKCLIGDGPRWQANYQNHYQWCLTARPEWVKNETKLRNDHLMHCGSRVRFD